MRIMTNKELSKVFHLCECGANSRTRKKNYHRVSKYLRRFGFRMGSGFILRFMLFRMKEYLGGKYYDY